MPKKRSERKGICALCGDERIVEFNRKIKKDICGYCRRSKLSAEVCSKCGHERGVAVRVDGKPVCGGCYREDHNIGICPICNNKKPLSYKDDKRRAICKYCYQTKFHLEPCSKCGQNLPVHKRVDGKPLCRKCYEELKPEEECLICGRLMEVSVRILGRPLCPACNSRLKRQGNREEVVEKKIATMVVRRRERKCGYCPSKGNEYICSLCEVRTDLKTA